MHGNTEKPLTITDSAIKIVVKVPHWDYHSTNESYRTVNVESILGKRFVLFRCYAANACMVQACIKS